MDKKDLILKNNSKIKTLEKNIDDFYQQNFNNDYEESNEDDHDQYEDFIRSHEGKEHYLNSLDVEKTKLIIENRKLSYEIENENLNNEIQRMSMNFKSGNVVSDKESKIDLLNRRLMAKILIRHIVKKDVDTPINVGVFGEWGEGKSNFIDFMKEEIQYLNKSKYEHICTTHIVNYDASEYDEKNKIWASLLSALFKEFEVNRGLCGKLKFAFYNLTKYFKINITKYLINILIIALFFIWFLNVKHLNDPTDSSFFSIVTLSGIIPLSLFITNILIPFIREQLNFVKPLSDRILSIVGSPDYSNELGARENIKDTLNDLIHVWINNKNERIVIFVDELDRCSEKTISEFFDALQLLLNVKGITVILSVNYKTVCYSIANKNKHYFDKDLTNIDKIEFGMSYLKKYVNIPIHLLKNYDIDLFISNIFCKDSKFESNTNISENVILNKENVSNENSDKNTILESEKSIDIDDSIFSSNELINIKNILVFMNTKKHITPREIKNIINILTISKEYIHHRNIQNIDSIIIFQNYCSWFLFHYFYRDISFNLIQFIKSNLHEDRYMYTTIKQFKKEYTKQNFFNNDDLSMEMSKFIDNIRIRDIFNLNDISLWFIGDYLEF